MPRQESLIGSTGLSREISETANRWAEDSASFALIGDRAIEFTTPWLVELAYCCCAAGASANKSSDIQRAREYLKDYRERTYIQ